NGSEKLRIDSVGNVGIGTTLPTNELNIIGDLNLSGGDKTIYFDGSGASGHATINETGGRLHFDASNVIQFEQNVSFNRNILNLGTYTDSGAEISTNVINTNTADMIFSAPNAGVYSSLTLYRNGNVGIKNSSPAVSLDVTGTDAIIVPQGTTAQRPGVGEDGMIRYNTTTTKMEVHENGGWVDMVNANGEANAAANVGSGTGTLYRDKTSSTLNFKSLAAGSTKLSITNNADDVTLDVNQSNIDHGSITGLGDDDHAQYALLSGRTGGQSLIGGDAASDNLILESTSNATKGDVILQPNGGQVGIGTSSPEFLLHAKNTGPNGIAAENAIDDDNMRRSLYARRSRSSATTPGAGFGPIITLQAEGFTDNSYDDVGRIGAAWEVPQSNDTTDRDSYMTFSTLVDGVTREQMRIDSAGNVGIGTTTPSGILDIEGGDVFIGAGTLTNTSGNEDLSVAGNVEVDGIIYGNGAGLTGVIASSSSAASNTTNYVINADSDGNNSGSIQLQVNGVDRLVVDNTNTISVKSNNGSTENILLNKGNGTVTSDPDILFNSQGSIAAESSLFLLADTDNDETSSIVFGFNSESTSSDLEVMRITETGSVGIGTTTPESKLNVIGGGVFEDASSQVILRESDAADPNDGWHFSMNGEKLLFIHEDDSAGPTLTYPMTMTPSGNIGIGTTSPASPLQVSTNTAVTGGIALTDSTDSDNIRARLRTSNPGGHGLLELYDNTEVAQVSIRSSSNTYFNGGNVGIGTTTPTSKLHLVDGSITHDSFSPVVTVKNRAANGNSAAPSAILAGDIIGQHIWAGYGATAYQANSTAKIVVGAEENFTDATGASYMAFHTRHTGTVGSSSERVRIDSTGNVGIGTTIPNSPLTIVKEGIAVAEPVLSAIGYSGSPHITIDRYNGTAASPSKILDDQVMGNINFSGYGDTGPTTNSTAIKTQASEDFTDTSFGADLAFWTANTGVSVLTEKMRITSEGNVGIGSSSPARLLHVEGPMRLTASTTPASPAAGDIFIDSADSNKLKYYDGAQWVNGGGSGDFLADGTVAMTGSFKASTGSAANPSITFNADSNTGFFSSSSDAIGISNGGSLSWRIFGTSIGSTTSLGPLMTAIGSTAANPVYAFKDDSDTGIFRAAADELGFSNNGSESMRIDSSGNVGIGTTTPAGTLDVGPSGKTICLNGTCRSTWPSGSGTGAFTDGGTKAYYTGGNVGIGTTNPGSILDLIGNVTANILSIRNNSSSGWSSIDFKDNSGTARLNVGYANSSAAGGYAGLSYINGANGNPIALGVDGTEIIRLNSSGNVGIGTVSPASTLHSHGLVTITDGASVSGNGAINFADANNGNTVNTSSIFGTSGGLALSGANSSANSPDLFVDNSGAVGVGTTSPASQFHVKVGASYDLRYGGILVLKRADLDGTNKSMIQFHRADDTVVGHISSTTTGTTYHTTSDRRLKENLEKTKRGLTTLLNIPIYDFNYIADPDKTAQQGYIAQDLYEVYPEAVNIGGEDPSRDPWTVDYGRLTPLLVSGIQDLYGICKIEESDRQKMEIRMSNLIKNDQKQDRDIASLKEKNAALEKENQHLKERLKKIETLLGL
ncbi:MAG: tail fiber domain-containing protein, partial [Bdellovibrionales bacterium]|nr:tail fiber domain-containing protein [Bdellovibrionales bacterium]